MKAARERKRWTLAARAKRSRDWRCFHWELEEEGRDWGLLFGDGVVKVGLKKDDDGDGDGESESERRVRLTGRTAAASRRGARRQDKLIVRSAIVRAP